MAKSFRDLDDVAKQYEIGKGQKGDWLKLEEGDNRVRVVSGYEVLAKHWAAGKMLGICIGKDKGCESCNAPDVIDEKTQKPKDKRPQVKFLMWVFDRNDDNKIKIAELGWTIVNAMRELSNDTEYGFTDDLPPYDMNIKKTVKGTGKNPSDTEYTVVPARQNTPLTEEEKAVVAALTPIETVVEKMKAKAAGNETDSGKAEYPKDDIDPDSVPF